MSTYTLPYPADLEDRLECSLPHGSGCRAAVHVTPRDEQHRKCAVWQADHHEISAHYSVMNPDLLGPLEEALQAVPGVYLTTRIQGLHSEGVKISNPDWPAKLGTSRRGRGELRPQVLALIHDLALPSTRRLPDRLQTIPK